MVRECEERRKEKGGEAAARMLRKKKTKRKVLNNLILFIGLYFRAGRVGVPRKLNAFMGKEVIAYIKYTLEIDTRSVFICTIEIYLYTYATKRIR